LHKRAVSAGVASAALLTLLSLTPAQAGPSPQGVPTYQHVGVLVLENESESAAWGATSPATYLKSLVPSGAFASNYYADGHVSLDNYITMTSGQPGNPQTYSDCLASNLFACQQTVNTPAYGNGVNIADQVEGAGLSWKEYADSAPSSCFHADTSPTASGPDPYQGNSSSPPGGNYADRHNPFVYYTDITNNATRCAQHVTPFTDLATDITNGTVPNYFFITPDTCHDGHDSPCASGSPMPAFCPGGASAAAAAGGMTAADCWLSANLPSLLQYLYANDGVLFITTDEGSNSDTSGCCTGGPGGQQGFGGKVGLFAIGPGVHTGFTSTVNYDHASLLRTTEDVLGIATHLNNAASASSMSDLFAAPSGVAPEAPFVVILPLCGAALAAWAHQRRRDVRPLTRP
jgi:phosphatidylinositol-3-phosphatase